MWRLALLAACVAVALAEDGLQLHVMPCPLAAIGSNHRVSISWRKHADECQYTIRDASEKVVEAKKSNENVSIAITAIGRYKVELACGEDSEAMYFDTTFQQTATSSGKQITATAFPWYKSAYVSFSSIAGDVDFKCKIDDAETSIDCTSPWNPGTLASGTHNLHLSLSVPKEGAVELEAIESLTIPIRV